MRAKNARRRHLKGGCRPLPDHPPSPISGESNPEAKGFGDSREKSKTKTSCPANQM
jgi:hypothetical protein